MTRKRKLTTFEKLQHNTNAFVALAGAAMGVIVIAYVIEQMEIDQFEIRRYYGSVEAPQPSG